MLDRSQREVGNGGQPWSARMTTLNAPQDAQVSTKINYKRKNFLFFLHCRTSSLKTLAMKCDVLIRDCLTTLVLPGFGGGRISVQSGNGTGKIPGNPGI
jgi:hypothetical protein